MRESTREGEAGIQAPPRPHLPLQTVRWALHSQSPPIQHVCVDHRRLKTVVAQQFLDCSNIRTAFQQMCREGVTERVAGRTLRYAARTYGLGHRALNRRVVDVMSPAFATFALDVNPRCGEDVLPTPVAVGIPQLSPERIG